MAKKIIEIEDQQQSWNGYTLDEIIYRKAITMTRLEIQKESISQKIQSVIPQEGTYNIGKTILNNFIGKLSTVEYIMIGFKIAMKVAKLWKKWKNNS